MVPRPTPEWLWQTNLQGLKAPQHPNWTRKPTLKTHCGLFEFIQCLYHVHLGPFRSKNLPKLPVLGSISGTFAPDVQAHLQDHRQIPAPQPEDALVPHDVHTALEETSARCGDWGPRKLGRVEYGLTCGENDVKIWFWRWE